MPPSFAPNMKIKHIHFTEKGQSPLFPWINLSLLRSQGSSLIGRSPDLEAHPPIIGRQKPAKWTTYPETSDAFQQIHVNDGKKSHQERKCGKVGSENDFVI